MEKVTELEDFIHLHPLILKEQLDYNGEQVVCSGCEEPISGACYSCLSCYFFLHQKCSDLPMEINHHLHPQHPLFLIAKSPYDEATCICDKCDKACNSFVYHCYLCNFDLDVQCAFPPCLSENDKQEHQFIRLISSLPVRSAISFTCNACGTDGDEPPYLCTVCLLMVHENCISLPYTIRTKLHHHPQILRTYSLGQDRSVKQYCGFCRMEVKAGFGGYYCPHCEFVAHVVCALGIRANTSKSKEEEEVKTTVDDELMEPVAYSVREIKQGEKIIIAEIKHFSHQHNLSLIDEVEVKDDLKCDGCMLPISSAYYSCVESKFLLDRSCVELPRLKKVNYLQQPLTLVSTIDTHDGVFFCYHCGRFCHGFHYRCIGYERFFFDVRCANLSEDLIRHEGHQHPLFYTRMIEDYHCNACGAAINFVGLRCNCGFNLDARCVTLPRKVRHKYDDHPLFLTYVDPNTYQFYCQICEKERDPKLWFYRCEACDFDAHPDCVLGKNPFVKLGSTYTYSIHSHPLALVEKIEDNPACHTCGKPCNDLALECTDSDCDFIIHRKKLNCMRLSDSDGKVMCQFS